MVQDSSTAPISPPTWLGPLRALMDLGKPVRAGHCARTVGVSSQKAHRILSNMVLSGAAIRLTRGLYAPAGYELDADDPEIVRASVAVRRRVLDFLSNPSSREELFSEHSGDLTVMVLNRLIEEGLVVTSLAPEGELLQLASGQAKGEARRFSSFLARVNDAIPSYPRVIRLSRLTEHLAGKGRGAPHANGVFGVRARARAVIEHMTQAGDIETIAGLRRDVLIRRSRHSEGGENAIASEEVADALGNCLTVLAALKRAPDPLGVVALRDLTGLSIACNSGIICRMERAGLIASVRQEPSSNRPAQVRYRLSKSGEAALAWQEESHVESASEFKM